MLLAKTCLKLLSATDEIIQLGIVVNYNHSSFLMIVDYKKIASVCNWQTIKACLKLLATDEIIQLGIVCKLQTLQLLIIVK